MKLIQLQAFGGFLKQDGYLTVENIKEYRVPYTKENFGSMALALNEPFKVNHCVFKPTGKHIILGNKNTAEIFELELPLR